MLTTKILKVHETSYNEGLCQHEPDLEETMPGDPFAMPRRYTEHPDRAVPGNPPQRIGRPRPGHGTVYLQAAHGEAGNRALARGSLRHSGVGTSG
jgi:hypothetical protein